MNEDVKRDSQGEDSLWVKKEKERKKEEKSYKRPVMLLFTLISHRLT
jgi:hypothetical protein